MTESERDVSSTNSLIEDGLLLFEAGSYLEAASAFGEARDAGVDWVGLNLGNALRAGGKLQEASLAYERAWRSGDSDSGYNLASLLEELGKPQEAQRVYEELVDSEYPAANIALAWEIVGTDPDRAYSLPERVAGSDDIVGILASGILGHWLFDSGDQSPRTEALLRRGVSEYPSARSDLAELLISRGETETARQLLLDGLPGNENELAFMLARLEETAGDVQAAKSWYQRGAEHGDGHSMYNLFLLLEAEGNLEEAAAWLHRATEASALPGM